MILAELTARSRATPAFLEALEAFRRGRLPSERLDFDMRSPVVKVERTLTQLLARHPELAIERVRIEARSGCEFFQGVLNVVAGGEEKRIHFHWDCRWKAEQEGFTDYFGYPDQIRAAREFGHDCFRQWEIVDSSDPLVQAAAPI
jgi:hypothetical protein